jgi:hypothetical protein
MLPPKKRLLDQVRDRQHAVLPGFPPGLVLFMGIMPIFRSRACAYSCYGMYMGWLQCRNTVAQSRRHVLLTMLVTQVFSSRNPCG